MSATIDVQSGVILSFREVSPKQFFQFVEGGFLSFEFMKYSDNLYVRNGFVYREDDQDKQVFIPRKEENETSRSSLSLGTAGLCC